MERTTLLHQCHLLILIISKHADKWLELDLLAGYWGDLCSRGKVRNRFLKMFYFFFYLQKIIPVVHGTPPPSSQLPCALQNLLQNCTFLKSDDPDFGTKLR